MEFADGFWENRPAQGFFLNEPLGLGEPARVAGGAFFELDGVDHAIAIEEVVAGGGLEVGVGPVTNVDAGNGFGYFSGNRK